MPSGDISTQAVGARPTGDLSARTKDDRFPRPAGFVRLARRLGQLINNATFQPFRVFLAVAALYFVVCYPLSQLSRLLERRLHAGSAY